MNSESPPFYKLWKQLNSYVKGIKWLCIDAIRNFGRKILLIIILSISGVVLGVASFGGVVITLNHLISGTPLILKGVDLTGISNKNILFITIVMGLASGAILYISEWLITGVAVSYHKLCIARIFKIVTNPIFEGWQRLSVDNPKILVKNLTGIASRLTAMSVQKILQGILQIFIFVFALVSMFIIYPVFTVLTLPLGFLYLIPLYRFNIRTAQHQRDFVSSNAEAGKTMSNAIKKALDGVSSDPDNFTAAEQCFSSNIVNKANKLFFQRQLDGDRVNALNSVFFFTALLCLFIYVSIFNSAPDWIYILAYIIALRFTVNSLRGVTGTFLLLSRFSPQYHSYSGFVDTAGEISQQRSESTKYNLSLPDNLEFKCEIGGVNDSNNSLVVQKGDIIWVIQSAPPELCELKKLASCIEMKANLQCDMFSKATFLTEPHLEHNQLVKIKDLLSGDDFSDDSLVRLRGTLQSLGVIDELNALPLGLKTPLNQWSTVNLSAEAVYAVNFLLACNQSEAVFIGAQKFLKFEDYFRENIFSIKRDCYTFIVSDDPEMPLKLTCNKERKQIFIVFHQGTITGCADEDWFSENILDIKKFFIDNAMQNHSHAGSDREDEFE